MLQIYTDNAWEVENSIVVCNCQDNALHQISSSAMNSPLPEEDFRTRKISIWPADDIRLSKFFKWWKSVKLKFKYSSWCQPGFSASAVLSLTNKENRLDGNTFLKKKGKVRRTEDERWTWYCSLSNRNIDTTTRLCCIISWKIWLRSCNCNTPTALIQRPLCRWAPLSIWVEQ